MCGRYALRSREAYLAAVYGLIDVFGGLTPRYNIAPMQWAPVVVNDAGGKRVLRSMRWGLTPRWADDPAIGNRLINARAETIAAKPAFREAYQHRRCAIPADGFYEWQKQGRGKQPYYIHRRDGEPLAFAGLWESWTGPDRQSLDTFTIITTEPNELMRPIHNRMPVILQADEVADWLGDDILAAAKRLRPCDDDLLEAVAVSTQVNSPANDGPQLIKPMGKDPDMLF
ncbi:SOS response-associated peptidase [Planctomycetales bacterium ZRK34]|nr:SOS response-associated peptidase [Planctomycetales bacterium ZRK34]